MEDGVELEGVGNKCVCMIRTAFDENVDCISSYLWEGLNFSVVSIG